MLILLVFCTLFMLKSECLYLLSLQILNSQGHLLGVGEQSYNVEVRVLQDRELGNLARLVQHMLVGVTAEHNINIRLVEEWHKEFVELLADI